MSKRTFLIIDYNYLYILFCREESHLKHMTVRAGLQLLHQLLDNTFHVRSGIGSEIAINDPAN
jgi:hypothetical protein